MRRLLLVLALAGAFLAGSSAAPASTPLVGVESSCACGSYPTPWIVACVPSVGGSFLVIWSDGTMYHNPWGCW